MPEDARNLRYIIHIEACDDLNFESVVSSSPELEVVLAEAPTEGTAVLEITVRNPQSICQIPFPTLQLMIRLSGSNGAFVVAVPVHASITRALSFTPTTPILGPVEAGVPASMRVSVSCSKGDIQHLHISGLDEQITAKTIACKDGVCEIEFFSDSLAPGVHLSHPTVSATVVSLQADGTEISQNVASSIAVRSVVLEGTPK